MSKVESKTHFVSDIKKSRGKALCGKSLKNFTTKKDEVTCKRCLQLLKNQPEKPELKTVPFVHYAMGVHKVACGGKDYRNSTRFKSQVTCPDCLKVLK